MAKKTFPYAVIVNGEIIPPNTPVDIDEPTENESNDEEAPKKPKKKAGKKNDNEGTV